MLGKTSVSMMVLLVAASLIGISSIHQYIEGSQVRAPLPLEGQVTSVLMRLSPSKECWGDVVLPEGNLLKARSGTTITLIPPVESCTIFGLAKTSNTPMHFLVPAPTAPSTIPYHGKQYNAIQVGLLR